MNRKTNSINNGRLTSGQRSGIRLTLATGATLAMLISAQLFASGSTAMTQNTAQVAAVSTSVQIATVTPTTVPTYRDENVTNTTSTSTVFSTQSQPVPSTHSSK